MLYFNRILLIDDDEITIFLHKHLIEQMSITREVVSLRSAEKALKFIAKSYQINQQDYKQDELILLDINMPGMNGFEFLSAFKSSGLPDHFKFIIVSSSANPTDIKKAQDYQICGYVTKPLTEQKVLAIMEEAQQKITPDSDCTDKSNLSPA